MLEQLLRKRVTGEELDYPLLLDVRRNYSNPRAKITWLLNQGVLIRVKKGLYVFGPDFARGLYSLEILANLVYGPSCVSLQYALSYYGLIPERVRVVTCVTPKRDKIFDTPLGRFLYRYQRPVRYPLGVSRQLLDNGQAYLIASREKALVDLLTLEYKSYKPSGLNELAGFLFDSLRCDEDGLRELSVGRLKKMKSVHDHPSVDLLYKLVKKDRSIK